MSTNLYLLLCSSFLMLLCVCLNMSRITKKSGAKYRLPAWNTAVGVERNLDSLLSSFQGLINAPLYSFYLYQSTEDRYVLKAVRQSVNDMAIAPSYSGLVSYEGQAYKSPVSLYAEKHPVTSKFLEEGDLSYMWLPLQSGIGAIKIGPIKRRSKKEMKLLEGYCSFLAEPLQELLHDIEKNDHVLSPVTRNSLKEKLRLAESYALYYGHGNGEKLSLFDVMIVEAKGYTVQQFQDLKASKRVVITYVSVMEVHPTEAIFQELSKEDLLFVDGKLVRNEAFGTFVVNLQSKKWMNHLLGKVHHLLSELKADGLFLDTIGDIEWPSIPLSIKQNQLDAVINFLHVLRLLYADHLFIQNNGLESIYLETAPYIDGICWENPPFSVAESEEWIDYMIQHLTFLQKKFQLKVFLLLEESTENEKQAQVYSIAKDVAMEKDFLLYIAPKDYVEDVNVIN